MGLEKIVTLKLRFSDTARTSTNFQNFLPQRQPWWRPAVNTHLTCSTSFHAVDLDPVPALFKNEVCAYVSLRLGSLVSGKVFKNQVKMLYLVQCI